MTWPDDRSCRTPDGYPARELRIYDGWVGYFPMRLLDPPAARGAALMTVSLRGIGGVRRIAFRGQLDELDQR